MITPQPEITALATLQADLLCRLATGGSPELLRRIVTALGDAREQNHVCIDLARWIEEPGDEGDEPKPKLDALREQLLLTGVVGDAADANYTSGAHHAPHPLVIDAKNRLYTLRHYLAERRIAQFIQKRLQREPATSPIKLRNTLKAVALLPDPIPEQPDWQLGAVVAGAIGALTVLCGGPGTGKTTTVAKLLSALLHDDPAMRIAIAAPTGKAAARLGEALQARAAEHPELSGAFAKLEPRTLHRLLGYLPFRDSFRFGRDKQLPYDLVVIDEVSMVDPAIFAALCDALPDDARLVLVGDKDQLAAVAAGQVLGDICHAAMPEQGLGKQLSGFIEQSTGMSVATQENAAPIANATVALWHNHRFGQQPGIGTFAQSMMQRRPKDAMTALMADYDDLNWTECMDTAMASIEPHLVHLMEAASSNDPDRALEAITHARVLTAQRRGPAGAIAWNAKIEARLGELGHHTLEPYYPGRPILITSNDQGSSVWNGDLGVCGRNQDGAPVVWLRDPHGSARELNPGRLPSHETAWAMTVHKAQGSEFEHVLLMLPDREGPLNHASLIYTGVTRAKSCATVCANRELLTAGLASWPERHSGLADALRST